MRFLICLRGEKLSRPTLHFAALMASRLSTDVTVLFVAPGMRRSSSVEAHLVQEKMSEWALDSPGNEVLRAARDHLQSMGILHEAEDRESVRELLLPGFGEALELTFMGRGGENVSFRLRQGDPLEEILAELRTQRYDLLVIGGGEGRSLLVERLLQFSHPSVLVVKNPLDIRYRVLVATDASPPAHRAELLAIRAASFLKMELTFLSVSRADKQRAFMEMHLSRMSGLCELKGVSHRVLTAAGSVVTEVVSAAGQEHLIFVGRSRRGTLRKLLFGSKAIRIANRARCPVLVVR
jgi:nucleotide-binding universal stress UspA family protein